MNSLVAFEGTCLRESNTTMVTHIRLVVGVSTLVERVTAMNAKSFATFLAEKPVVVRMQHLVLVQILAICKGEPTYVANVRLFAGVSVDMVLHMSAPSKNLFTQQALVLHSYSHKLWRSASATRVRSPLLLGGKLHPTTFASKRFRATVLLVVLSLVSYES
jgi:hypothetical protein